MATTMSAPGPRPIGDSGMSSAPLAWGMWRFGAGDLASADRLVRTALDCGITLLDTADVYGFGAAGFGAAETLLGRVIDADPGLRRRFVLASKGGVVPGVPYDSSVAHLIAACEASLRRLRTDCIDLYQIHRPDVLAHPQEVAGALEQLRASGKIGAAGVSNYSASQAWALQSFLSFPLASHQPEFSVLHIEPIDDGVLDQALEQRMAVLAWSPLGGGRLAGADPDARARAVIDAVDRIAERERASRTAVALAWVLAHPSCPIAIIGTQQPERIREAMRALDVRLTRQDWYTVFTASREACLP